MQMIELRDIRRIQLGHYTMPAESRLAGQKIVVCAYVVRVTTGYLLFDTGIGRGDAAAEQEFGPIERRPLNSALADLGIEPRDVSVVANCHLHLDHCGGNPLFPHTPIFVQKAELDALSTLDYVVPDLVEFDGVSLEVHDGEAEPAPGVRIIPTPGHTPGHQSLLIDSSRGRVVLAGQAIDSVSDFSRARFALQLPGLMTVEDAAHPPAWMRALLDLDVRLVLFAHDLMTWDRDVDASAGPQ
jgi:N-acyl homoserine lactone hydrolase